MQPTVRVGHSPDPDDAFMFYALAHDKLDTGDLAFQHELQDIETLNRRALRGELEVTAISIHAYAHLLDKYALLPSGCSMGDRYGPMVVARRPLSIDDLKKVKIAVPGTLTTAFLALRLHERRQQPIRCSSRSRQHPRPLPQSRWRFEERRGQSRPPFRERRRAPLHRPQRLSFRCL